MKFSGGEGRAKGRVRLLWARGSAKLGKVTTGSGTQEVTILNIERLQVQSPKGYYCCVTAVDGCDVKCFSQNRISKILQV